MYNKTCLNQTSYVDIGGIVDQLDFLFIMLCSE
jgi:hypothetical protein